VAAAASGAAVRIVQGKGVLRKLKTSKCGSRGCRSGSRVRIPARVKADGWRTPGDLYIITKVGLIKLFHRARATTFSDCADHCSEAALGAKIEVPTVTAKRIVRIPPALNRAKISLARRGGRHGRSNGSRRSICRSAGHLAESDFGETKELLRKSRR